MPYYLAIGMTSDEFWNGEPRLAKVYREAHEMRNEMLNQELWVAGLYNHRAFTAVAEALAYGISGGKGSKPSQYPEEPLPLTEKQQKIQMEKNKQRTLTWVQSGQR